MSQNYRYKKAETGACYYPEHWDKSLWEQDLQRMLEHGIKTVRVAEFAWNIMEPKDGEFDFSFFGEFLTLCDKVGMKVILGTPSATPPCWLTDKYPEVLNAQIDGKLYNHGARRHYNYNSPIYRKYCSRLVEKMADAYAKFDCVVGWQIDNELNCETSEFYSESDTVAFRTYLKDKFKTLDNLNKSLGMTFWNQTYTDWEEIHVPRLTINGTQNPHFKLEYKRFISHSVLSFAKMQADIIRKYKKNDDFITTNGMFGNINNNKLAEDVLDIYHFDSYPNFAYMMDSYDGGFRDRQSSKSLSEVRSVCEHFGIMEQQSGANGWTSCMEGMSPKPNQIKLWSTQSIAHGADYISYFRWRTSPMGTEIYWHGILDYDNRDNRKLKEVTEFAKRLENMSDVVNEDYEASFGVIRDYDNMFDRDVDIWHGRVSYTSEQGIFESAQENHAPFNYVAIYDDTNISELSKYKVLFYPHPAIITEKRADLLKEYVENGGKLVFGCRVGYKDIYGKCPFGRVMPGLLCDLVGADVREFTLTKDNTVKAVFKDGKVNCVQLREILDCKSAKSIATYDGDYCKGETVATENTYGNGKVYYYGSTFTKDVADYFIKLLSLDNPMKEIITCPPEIEIEKRGKYLFILNYLGEERKVTLNKKGTDVDTGKAVCGEITLSAYGSLVIRLD